MTTIKPKSKTTLITAFLVAVLALGTAQAFGATWVPLSKFNFNSAAERQSFVKLQGTKCSRKWRKTKELALRTGASTKHCLYRTSVVADAKNASQQILASTKVASQTPSKMRARVYTGVTVRASADAYYELRIRPLRQRWLIVKDPKGYGGPVAIASGSSDKIRASLNKVNALAFSAREVGGGTELVARLNGDPLHTMTDTGTGRPDGHHTGLALGTVSGSANGAVGIFDVVIIRGPMPNFG